MSKKQEKKFGFVALVGPPNAGKSTLLNHLIGQKIAITSRKPQTTRHRILGIKTTASAQVVFVDTPGIHVAGKKTLNRVINKTAMSSLEDVDLILFMIDDREWNPETEHALNAVLNAASKQGSDSSCPIALIINKSDQYKDKKRLLPLIAESQSRHNFDDIIPISAKHAQNIDELWQVILNAMPADGMGFGFPEGQITDKSQRFLASELVREQLFRQLGQELPYSTAVEVNKFEIEESSLLSMDMTIWVDRKGQKGIIVGKKGEKLKNIGQRARLQMERLFGHKVYLSLWVKVRSGWADNASMLKSLGYMED